MTGKRKDPESGGIRQRAEEALAQRPQTGEHGESDMQRLVHELQVHQIELEMQNEALRQAQAETRAARDRLADLNARLEDEVVARSAALMRSEARATQILESSADGLYGVDAQGCITFINRSACELLGVRAGEAIGRSKHRLIHSKRPDGGDYPEDECPALAALKRGQTVRVDTEVYWHADGHAVPVMYAVHPLSMEGRCEGAVISFVDMSEQRAAMIAREEALYAAENLARLRSEFVANMSHEIRTPLTGILGFAEIGARNHGDSAKARRAFEHIKASGQHLLDVVNNILDYSRIDAGRLPIEAIPVTTGEIVQQSVALVEDRIKSKHLGFSVDISHSMPATFIGDPLRIRQVLINLLNNAAKFTESGSIALTILRESNDLVFRVADTGIGMDEVQVGQLFQAFHQLDGSMSRRFGGTGLGLSITKRIVDLMHGSIDVQSTPRVGSTFTVRLPYVRPPASTAG
jgi:PAS domain S-box-containing protein